MKARSRNGREALPLEIMAQLAASFDVQDARVHGEPSYSWANVTLRLTSRQGELILRRPRDTQLHSGGLRNVLARLQEEHWLTAYLAQRGLKVSTPMLAMDGNTIVSVDGVPYSLYHYIAGREMASEDPAQVSRAAAALASFHRQTASYPQQVAAREDRFIQVLQQRVKDFHLNLRGLRSSLASLEISGSMGFFEDILPDIGNRLASLSYSILPTLLIHGDYRRQNLLFRNNELACILDFDRCRYEARVLDLAIAIADLAPSVYDTTFLESARLFFSTYNQTLPLTETERRALPVLILARVTYQALRIVRRISKSQGSVRRIMHARRFRRYVGRLQWLTENWKLWQDVFQSGGLKLEAQLPSPFDASGRRPTHRTPHGED